MKNWTEAFAKTSEDQLVKILGGTYSYDMIYAAQVELIRRADASPCPHLDQWHKELAAGKRTADQFDELWTKACNEIWDRELNAIRRAAHHKLLSTSFDCELGF